MNTRKLSKVEEIILPSGRIKYADIEDAAKDLPRPLFEQFVRRHVLLGTMLEFELGKEESVDDMFGSDDTRLLEAVIVSLPAIKKVRGDAESNLIYPIMRTKPSSLKAKAGEFHIGRGSDNDFVVPDFTISRHHAKIIFKNNRYYIQDLNSANGTRVNGEKCGSDSVDLYEGDDIQLGRYKFTLQSPKSLYSTLLDMKDVYVADQDNRQVEKKPAEEVVEQEPAQTVAEGVNYSRDELIANAKKYKGILDKLSLFSGFTDLERLRIAAFFTNIKKYGIGDFIVKQGNPGNSFYLLLEGSAFVTIDGKTTPLAHIPQGDFFGEISFFSASAVTSNVICQEPCTVLELGENVLSRFGVIMREKFKDLVIKKVLDRLEQQNQMLTDYKAKDQGIYTKPIDDHPTSSRSTLKDSEENRRLIRKYLEATPFFESFSEYEKNRISKEFTHIVMVQTGTLLIRQGSYEKFFYVLLSGEVLIVNEQKNSTRVVIKTLKSGNVFGEIPFLTGDRRSTHTVAAEKCILLRVDSELMTQMGAEVREKYKDSIMNVLLSRIESQNRIIQKYKSSLYFNV